MVEANFSVKLKSQAEQFPVKGQNFLSQVKDFLSMVNGRNFLLQEDISCHRKKFLVTGKNFLSKEDISSHRKNFCLQEKISSQEEISCNGMKFPVTGRYFPSIYSTIG